MVIGRVVLGSGRVGSLSYRGSAGGVGSGRVRDLVGRIGSRKMDRWTTLVIETIFYASSVVVLC